MKKPYLTQKQLTTILKKDGIEPSYELLMRLEPIGIWSCKHCHQECFRYVRNFFQPLVIQDYVHWGDDGEEVLCKECWDKI